MFNKPHLVYRKVVATGTKGKYTVIVELKRSSHSARWTVNGVPPLKDDLVMDLNKIGFLFAGEPVVVTAVAGADVLTMKVDRESIRKHLSDKKRRNKHD